MRLVCALVAAVIVAVGLFVALTLPSNSTGVIEFGAADQIAVAGLALLLGAGVLFLGRSIRASAAAIGEGPCVRSSKANACRASPASTATASP